jgi:tetratricopeptide (TPR) repeat protein
MSLRPKTKRRLLQLTGGGAAVAGLAAAGVAVQLHRHESARQSIRVQGMVAFNRGDYRRTLVELQKYLNDDRTDPDAIYALAVARTRVPEPEQGHLIDARGLLVRYLELRPNDVAAQHLLLDIYQRLQFRYETTALADALLAKDPADTAALSAKWQDLYRQDRLDAALATVEELDRVDPTNVPAQEATLELMARLHRPASELTGRAQGLLDGHPSDPRFELLRAVAAHLTGDDAGTRRWLSAAAAGPSPDGAFTLTLAGAFDRIGQWGDAIAVLRRAGPSAPPAVRAALVERLWFAGQPAAALDQVRDVAPTDPHADAALLGLKALLLDGAAAPTDALAAATPAGPATRPAELNAIRSALTARGDDPLAACWAALVRGTDPLFPVEPRQAVALTGEAARDDVDSAPARFFLGRSYLRLGEPALAMEAFAQAAMLAPSWAAPRLLLARTLLDANRPDAAAAPARGASDRDPSSTDARAALAVIAYRTLSPRAPAGEVGPVLAQVRTAADASPDDPRLCAAAVDLTARVAQAPSPTATATALSYIRRLTITPAQLYRLAAVAAVDHLDVSAAVVARATATQPATADDAYQLAMALSAAGAADRGRQLLATAVAAHADQPEWQLADVRYRDAVTPSAALADAWAALADANPTDLAVQRATLRSTAAAHSRPLIDRTIDRLHALTGDGGVEWRLARARYQLDDPTDGKPVGKDAANAVASSMAEVTRIVPHAAEPLELWATALEQLGDLQSAVARLRSAVPLAPDDPALPLRLAHLLARTGQFRAAADAVAPLAARSGDLTPAVAADVADVYRRAGDADGAVAVLRAAGQGPPDAARDVPLAQAEAAAGDLAAAAATFDRVNRMAPTPDSVRAAAWFYAATGDVAHGRQVLAQLDGLPNVSPVQRDVTRGQFTAAFGEPAAARSQLEAAARSAPDDPRPWAALAGFDLHVGDAAAAVVAADRGLALAPADGALSALRARAQTVATLHLGPAAQPLLDALAIDPANPAAVATLDALAASSPAAAVRAVADRHPTFVPAQALVVDELVDAGRFDEAADVATRLADAAPSDPAPERMLVSVWTAADRPAQALAAAQRWRARSLAAPQAADVAIAAALIRQGHPQAAVQQVAPYVRAGTADADATRTYARALAAAGRADEADAVLRPGAVTSQRGRQAWLSVIADTAPTAADAASRIARVEPLLSPGSVDDRVAVADAWNTVGGRFNDADAFRRGLDELDPLNDVSDVPTDALVLSGALHQQLGQLPEAEAAYRRALVADPNLPRAMNNLAWVIALREGDLTEARRLAERAVALAPADAELRTTLGQVALQQGDVPAAAEAFRTATHLAPRSGAAWAGLADAQARAGHTGDAADALDRAEQLLASPPAPPSPTTAAELQRARAALGRPDTGPRTVRPVG